MPQATVFNIPANPPAPTEDVTERLIESLDALATVHSGTSRPAYLTTLGEGPWIDKVSGTEWRYYYYDGNTDLLIFVVNPTAHTVMSLEDSIASATTTNLASVDRERVEVTGTTTITSFGTGANLRRFVRFSGALTLTHNATSLILPTGASIKTAAGDAAVFVSDGSGNWRCIGYARADGSPLGFGAEDTIASSSTTDLASKQALRLEITGTTTITSFGSGANLLRLVRFAGVLTLTHHATSLILPGGANITTAAGDTAIFASDGSGNWRCYHYLRAAGTALVTGAADPKGPPAFATNLEIVASVSSNALTIALKTHAGADPSAGDPIRVPVRSATPGDGTVTTLELTAATSLVISSGSTLGTSNNVAFRFWIVLFNDGGTPRLGVINCRSGNLIHPLGKWPLATSTAEGGAGGADAAQTFYTGTAITPTAMPYAVLGELSYESGLATAGTYASAPTRVNVFGPTSKLPGEVVQTQFAADSTTRTTTGTSYGTASLSVAMAPTSAANPVLVSYAGGGDSDNAGNTLYFDTYRNGTGGTSILSQNGITRDAMASAVKQGAGSGVIPIGFNFLDWANVNTSVTWALMWRTTAGTATLNARNGGANTQVGTLTLKEIMS